MAKIKPILPTLREKKRFVAFRVDFEKKETSFTHFNAINSLIYSSFQGFVGVKGCAEAGYLMLKDKWNEQPSTGIIRINNKYVDALKASFLLINEIKNNNVSSKARVVPLGTSGTLKKALVCIE